MESMLALLSYIGTAVFAASGALLADEERFDIVGALFLAIATGLGGGTIVDLVIGYAPVRWVETPAPLWIAGGSGLAAYLLARVMRMPHTALIWADAVGLAVFTATGMERLTKQAFDPIVCIFLAAVGASGGGILRDVLANRTPIVFSPETELYVSAAFAGGIAYLAANALLAAPHAGMIAALAVTGFVRAAGIMFKLRLGTMRRSG